MALRPPREGYLLGRRVGAGGYWHGHSHHLRVRISPIADLDASKGPAYNSENVY